jgi:hypothetical protein
MVTDTKGSSRLGQAIAWGAGAGVVASIFMGVYAMVASLIKDTGFFTPLHHIATLFAKPADMMASMMAGMSGESSWELSAGTAILGLIIHMVTGAVYGAIFGAIVSQLKNLGAAVIAVAGLVYGGVVFVVSAFIGLPLAAAVFGVGDLAEGDMAGMNPIADMAEMAGWGTFVAEHLVFGLVLGLLLAARSSREA